MAVAEESGDNSLSSKGGRGIKDMRKRDLPKKVIGKM